VHLWAIGSAPICVGDTGTSTPQACTSDVSTPPTVLLTLLGLGAMGVMAYRRRREDALKRLAAELEGAAA
jgi:hypothetical protein